MLDAVIDEAQKQWNEGLFQCMVLIFNLLFCYVGGEKSETSIKDWLLTKNEMEVEYLMEKIPVINGEMDFNVCGVDEVMLLTLLVFSPEENAGVIWSA